MKAMLDLLICLHRHEYTARACASMSPRERDALQTQLDLVRGAIPEFILGHYQKLSRREAALDHCPAALAMATLVSAYRALPAQRQRRIHSFFDLAGYPARGRRRRVSRRKESPAPRCRKVE